MFLTRHMGSKALFYVWLWVLFALPAAAVAQRLTVTDKMLAENSPKKEVIWLEAGQDKFLGLFREATSPKVYGAMLLIPDEYANPDWTFVISPLRHAMNPLGWATLSIALPKQTTEKMTQVEAVNASGSASQEKQQPGNAINLGEQEAPIFARINAAVAWLKKHKFKDVVILGHGTGAMWAAAYFLKANPQPPVRGLILLSLDFPHNDEASVALNQVIPTIKQPVLDIYGTDDMSRMRQAVQVRMLQSRRINAKYYWARVIEGADHLYIHTLPSVLKTIRAWMVRHEKPLGLMN